MINFSFGPCSRTRALELIASVKEEAGPFAERSLMFDSCLEAGVAAHHLDFGLRSRQIFGMRFELRMRVGEVQKRHAFAVSTLIRSCRCRRSKSGDRNARADCRQTYRGGDDLSASPSLDHLPSFTTFWWQSASVAFAFAMVTPWRLEDDAASAMHIVVHGRRGRDDKASDMPD